MSNEDKNLELINDDTSDDVSAFDDAVAELLRDDKKEDTDSFDDVQDQMDDQLSDDDQTDEEDNDDIQDPQDDGILEPDYKVLYEQVFEQRRQAEEEREALRAEYLSWKGRMEALDQQAGPDTKTPSVPETDEELEEFFDLFPETAGPVQKLITKHVAERVGAVEDRLNQLYESSIRPLAERVREAEVQAHEAAILKAHPDLHYEVANGNFRKWVETLPNFQQIGVQQIIKQGDVNGIIGVFDEYKRHKPAKKDEPASTKQNNVSSIADKVINALGVSSEASRVVVDSKKNKEPSDPDKLFDWYAKQVMQEDSI